MTTTSPTTNLGISVREAIQKKNLLTFGFFPNDLHPPPVFLERFEELFENLILVELKFHKVFGFWSSPPFTLKNV